MASRKKRRDLRARRQKRLEKTTPTAIGHHAGVMLTGMDNMVARMAFLLDSPSPQEAAGRHLHQLVESLLEEILRYPLFQLCETVRLAFLPWQIGGVVQPDTEDGLTLAELVMLIAVTNANEVDESAGPDEYLFAKAKHWKEVARKVLDTAQVSRIIQISSHPPVSKLEHIRASVQGNELWIRNSSYPDMAMATARKLFGAPNIEDSVRAAMGFSASEAVQVLETCHAIQEQKWKSRLERSVDAFREIIESGEPVNAIDPQDPRLSEIRERWLDAWQGEASVVSVQPGEIAEKTGLSTNIVAAVAEEFRLNPGTKRPIDSVRRFVAGDNPFRSNPLIVASDGSMMLLHSSFNVSAVRENIEQKLKSQPIWEDYQTHRGVVLEQLTRDALGSMIPGAEIRTAFKYLVPASSKEASGQPDQYTKEVEGDLLLIQDDVAIIAEAKAVAVHPRARAGDTREIRRDLVDIITKASQQASRLADRIEDDGGVFLSDGGWLDLKRIREVHLIAVSLEDLVSVATATGELIDADIVDIHRIPWTVSIHDLQIIGELVSTPAEILLYLQRRCDPEVTRLYHAIDELDYFLYFFKSGLYVPPDPTRVEQELPFMKATTAAKRARRSAHRTFITSQTDALDSWHYSRLESPDKPAPKPAIGGSPILDFVRQLEKRRDFAWMSIGATLLSADTRAQHNFTKIPAELLADPHPSGRERSCTIPLGSTKRDAWLLAWFTKPEQQSEVELHGLVREYMHAKKYQLNLRRSAAFIFDETSRSLSAVLYDGTENTPDAVLDEKIKHLMPLDKMPHRLPPKAKRRGRKN